MTYGNGFGFNNCGPFGCNPTSFGYNNCGPTGCFPTGFNGFNNGFHGFNNGPTGGFPTAFNGFNNGGPIGYGNNWTPGFGGQFPVGNWNNQFPVNQFPINNFGNTFGANTFGTPWGTSTVNTPWNWNTQNYGNRFFSGAQFGTPWSGFAPINGCGCDTIPGFNQFSNVGFNGGTPWNCLPGTGFTGFNPGFTGFNPGFTGFNSGFTGFNPGFTGFNPWQNTSGGFPGFSNVGGFGGNTFTPGIQNTFTPGIQNTFTPGIQNSFNGVGNTPVTGNWNSTSPIVGGLPTGFTGYPINAFGPSLNTTPWSSFGNPIQGQFPIGGYPTNTVPFNGFPLNTPGFPLNTTGYNNGWSNPYGFSGIPTGQTFAQNFGPNYGQNFGPSFGQGFGPNFGQNFGQSYPTGQFPVNGSFQNYPFANHGAPVVNSTIGLNREAA